jgi:hypothetical protein
VFGVCALMSVLRCVCVCKCVCWGVSRGWAWPWNRSMYYNTWHTTQRGGDVRSPALRSVLTCATNNHLSRLQRTIEIAALNTFPSTVRITPAVSPPGLNVCLGHNLIYLRSKRRARTVSLRKVDKICYQGAVFVVQIMVNQFFSLVFSLKFLRNYQCLRKSHTKNLTSLSETLSEILSIKDFWSI